MPRNLWFQIVVLMIWGTQAVSFAEVTDVGFENQHTARIAFSEDDDSFYLVRAAGRVNYNFEPLERVFKILPFFEYQHNLDTNSWWRKEIGTEIGTSFFNDIFYYGASFQHVWQQEQNYQVENLEETTEWESRFVFNVPINWWLFKDQLKMIWFDEYTYDFTRGQPTINECGATVEWQVSDWLRVPIGWRHIDRIHDFDADMFELSVRGRF